MCPTTKSSLNHVEMSPVETFFNVELRQKVVTCRRMEKFIDQVTQAQESIGTNNYNHLQMFTTLCNKRVEEYQRGDRWST